MLGKRQELQKYITDTFNYINTVKEFCSKFSQWKKTRETEIELMKDLKEKDDRLDIAFSDAVGKKHKHSFKVYMTSKFQMKTDSKHAMLQNELIEVLKNTMEGLKELQTFLDAVEKLAVTSLHVFTKNQVLHLPENIDPDDVQAVIMAAQHICPLLLVFKRDAEAFFLPKFQNVEVLENMLEKYLETTKKICETLGKSFFSDTDLKVAADSAAEFDEALCENDKQKMIEQLSNIRMDEDFRMVFLFQEVSCSGFIKEFEARRPKLLKFLDELEECAVQLDRMRKGAKISSVAGSSVGAAGGVLSIAGLALIPFTAGASLILTMAGVGLGVTSGVNSIVTTATELGVNHTNKKKANEVFQNFMENIQCIQACLEEVINQSAANMKPGIISIAVGVGKIVVKAGGVGKAADAIVDAASAFKALKPKPVAARAAGVLAQEGKAIGNVPRLAADVPDIGQAAVKGPLALTKGMRAGFIAVNALFLGMDLFFITKDSMSLAKGSETKVSKFIRARAALWSSEIKSWEKIHDSLAKGLTTSGKKEAVLETPFYLDLGMENLEEEDEEEEIYFNAG